MKRVLIFGVFDLLHDGHRYFLEKSREYGDYLTVSVARDSYVVSHKGRKPVHDESTRKKALIESGLVDEVLFSDAELGSFNVIEQTHPDVICLGYDQHALKKVLSAWITEKGLTIDIATIPPYKEDTYKTTYLIANKEKD